MKRVGALMLVGVLAWSAAVAVTATAATAQDPDPVSDDADSGVGLVEIDDAALEPAEPFDGRATESTVRRSRLALLAIAGAMTVALAVFWWHTIPLRRLRIASSRAQRSRPESATEPEASVAVDRD